MENRKGYKMFQKVINKENRYSQEMSKDISDNKRQL
jgi:hypothetical protein